MKTRREQMVSSLQQPAYYGGPVPSDQELNKLTDDELLGRIAQKFQVITDVASAMIDEQIRASIAWERTQANQKAREEARLSRRPSRKMTLEQALARAKDLERERMELVAFINTIPAKELEEFERLTGMWASPKMNTDGGYTLSKLVKIFTVVLKGRRDPDARKAALAAKH